MLGEIGFGGRNPPVSVFFDVMRWQLEEEAPAVDMMTTTEKTWPVCRPPCQEIRLGGTRQRERKRENAEIVDDILDGVELLIIVSTSLICNSRQVVLITMDSNTSTPTSQEKAPSPRLATQFHTECQELANLSYKCLEKNMGNKDKCQGS